MKNETAQPKPITARLSALLAYEASNGSKATTWTTKAEAFATAHDIALEAEEAAQDEVTDLTAKLKAAKAKLAKAKRDIKSLDGAHQTAVDKIAQKKSTVAKTAQKKAKPAPTAEEEAAALVIWEKKMVMAAATVAKQKLLRERAQVHARA